MDKPRRSNAAGTNITFSLASLSVAIAVEELQLEEAIGRAEHGIGAMQTAPSMTENMEAGLDGSAGAADAVTSFADTWDSLLDKIKPFVDIVDDLGEVHAHRRTLTQIGTINTEMCALSDPPVRQDRLLGSDGGA